MHLSTSTCVVQYHCRLSVHVWLVKAKWSDLHMQRHLLAPITTTNTTVYASQYKHYSIQYCVPTAHRPSLSSWVMTEKLTQLCHTFTSMFQMHHHTFIPPRVPSIVSDIHLKSLTSWDYDVYTSAGYAVEIVYDWLSEKSWWRAPLIFTYIDFYTYMCFWLVFIAYVLLYVSSVYLHMVCCMVGSAEVAKSFGQWSSAPFSNII